MTDAETYRVTMADAEALLAKLQHFSESLTVAEQVILAEVLRGVAGAADDDVSGYGLGGDPPPPPPRLQLPNVPIWFSSLVSSSPMIVVAKASWDKPGM